MTCSSNGGSQSCPADTRNGVLLVREQSNNQCRQGQTWTFDRRGINVNGGCSADFMVNPRGGGSYGNSGYGNGNGNGGYGNGNGNGNGNNAYNNGNGGQYRNGSNYGGGGARVSIPQGTQVGFRMDQTVRLNELNQNDALTGTLANDLVVGGQTVAPSGTPVQAKVMSASGAPLDLRLNSMTVNGTTYSLQSNSVRGIRDAVNTPDTGGRSGLGEVLGTLAGAGSIPSGTVFNFRLTSAARPQ
ncbi:DUF3011 domain-containing protein [Terriglobus sp.]|uniref:DUF3011 domain-containing protein n=1 Tax=Terriglobus sp. TaxID=1889013 RepID=UPI003B00EEB2